MNPQAAESAPGSLNRLLVVSAFNVAYWSSSGTRSQYKALRPLPGETYELLDKDQTIAALAENVSLHHGSKMNTIQLQNIA